MFSAGNASAGRGGENRGHEKKKGKDKIRKKGKKEISKTGQKGKKGSKNIYDFVMWVGVLLVLKKII